MGMSHEHCTHPRTPAGRAACRKAGGPGASLTPTVTTPAPTMDTTTGVTDPKTIGAMMARNGRAGRRSTAQDRRMNAASEMVRESFGTTDTQPTPKTRSRASQPRSRAIRAVHDMADVPHVFSSVIKWAWDNNAEVRTGTPYNDHEQNIKVTTANGTATLVWRSSNPNGVYGVWFRGSDTSVQFRTTVNDAIRLLSE